MTERVMLCCVCVLQGLSPEEIDAYMRQQEAKRQEEDEQAAEH